MSKEEEREEKKSQKPCPFCCCPFCCCCLCCTSNDNSVESWNRDDESPIELLGKCFCKILEEIF